MFYMDRVDAQSGPDPAQNADEEGKLIRRLQLMMNLVMQTIAQDGSLTIDEASQMIADARKAALAMFPDKELAARSGCAGPRISLAIFCACLNS